MGQIIGSAAKPSRCNLQSLSDWGTPANGEYILVSSDNSMTSTGQGNFDAYIVGTGSAAATSLTLHPIAEGDIALADYDAVSGATMFEELRNIVSVENIATFSTGGYFGSTCVFNSLSGLHYIDHLDISDYLSLTICCRARSSAYNFILDANDNILYRWQSNTSPYITEIDLTQYPTAKYVCLSDYTLSNPYINGTQADNTATKTKITNLESEISTLSSSVAEVQYTKKTMFDIDITLTTGSINSSGTYVSDSYDCVVNVDISGYDLVVAYGYTYGSAYNAIYDSSNNVLAVKQGSTETVFDIKNDYPTAKYLSACSVTSGILSVGGIKQADLIGDVLYGLDETYFLYRQTISITQLSGFYNGKRKFNSSSSYVCYKSNLIKVIEGMTFSLTSNGSASTLNYITYDENLAMVSIVKGNTYTSEAITIPSGVAFIEFFSYSTALSVTCDQFVSSESSGSGNILYEKSYVAIGDSFTAAIGSDTIESGIYQGQSKVYPYIIGNRNNMSVLNQGSSGSVLNGYLANASYENIPSGVDYITIWYGINDAGHGISIGTIDDQPTSISTEGSTTTCGGFNFFFKWLLTNRPMAHVGVIVTDYCETLRREAIIACCEKWGIPYLDLYDPTIPAIRTRGGTQYTHSTSICPDGYVEMCDDAISLRTAIFSTDAENDNIHPNNDCHEWQSNIIEAFMRRI